jgi:hypothetical protein
MIINLLRRFGEKVGLIRIVVPNSSSKVTISQMKSMTLEELTRTLGEDRKQRPSPIVSQVTNGFDQVFEIMKLTKFQHGWNIERLAMSVRIDQTEKLNKDELRRAASQVLEANKVPLQDMLKDAQNRLQALEEFTIRLTAQLKGLQEAREREIEGFKKEISLCQEQMKHLALMQSQDESALEEWQKKKAEKQKEIQRIISLISS